MDEEGIMALEPRPMDQGPAPEQISYGEAYNATKNAVREYHPQIASQYEAGMGELLAEVGTLTAEELDALRDIVDYVEKNRDRYPQVIAELVAQDIIDEGDFPPQYDEEFMAVLRAAIEETSQRGMAIPLPSVQQFAMGGIASVAESMRQKGRFGDTMLAHITPQEAQMLMAMGGSGTINPQTGLPEFFFKKIFKGIKKAVKGIVKGVKKVLNSPIGRILATIALTPFVGPVAAGAIVGGITGGVKGAILGGIGGYVGSSGFVNNALGSTLGKGLVSTLGEAGAKFAIQTASGTAMGLAGGASLGDAVKGGVVNAAVSYAMTRSVPKGQEAPIEDRSISSTSSTSSGGATAPSPIAQAVAQPGGMGLQAPVPGNAEFFNQGRMVPTAATTVAQAPASPVPGSAEFFNQGRVVQGATPTAATTQGATPTAATTQASAVPDQIQTLSGDMSRVPGSDIASKMGIPTSSTGAAPAAPAAPDFSVGRLFNEPLSYTKDIYSTYLSPSRQGLSANAGILEKYGPLTAAGIGAMYAGGGFEPQQATGPGILPKETGADYINRAPTRYLMQNLPGVIYSPEGDIIGSRPYDVNTPSLAETIIPTESIFGTSSGFRPASFQIPQFNSGGIAGLSKRYPRRTGQIRGTGTETSDDIPAMLSDGEFVMTARAVRGMGSGSRRQGAKRMYKLMAALEQNAARKA